jgi:hypothetical protein
MDSALSYAQKAYTASINFRQSEDNITTALIFSRIYRKLQQYELAHSYCKMAIDIAERSATLSDIDQAYAAMAAYYDEMHLPDSAFYYQSKIVGTRATGFYKTKVTASHWLYQYYKQKHQPDSTIKYLELYMTGTDSINNTAKLVQIQKVNFEEDLRQQDLSRKKAAEEETLHHNIQLAIMAIVILGGITLFLLLSRSIIVSHRLIETLGVILLLIVFEFINLIVHPFLEKITDDSPVWMLLSLVAIAGLIAPIHHRLEKWTSDKLVAKNKAIRLAKAKKIVSQLEVEQQDE